MIDNLLNIQILVFVPPTLVCVWGGGAVWPVPALLLLSPQHQPGQQSQGGPSIHYLHICCLGGGPGSGELAWDTRYGLQMHYYTGEKFLNFIRHYILI